MVYFCMDFQSLVKWYLDYEKMSLFIRLLILKHLVFLFSFSKYLLRGLWYTVLCCKR